MNQNNSDIQLNQEEIDKLLSENSLQVKKKDLDELYNLNKELLNENSDFVQMQLDLNEFLKKYRHLFPESSSEIPANQPGQNDSEKVFAQTVAGKLKFDSAHPQYNNSRFFQELLKYYEIHENYEMCDRLMKLRKL